MNVYYSTGNHLIRQEKDGFIAPLSIRKDLGSGSGIQDDKNARIRITGYKNKKIVGKVEENSEGKAQEIWR
jgi:hypothetical protein